MQEHIKKKKILIFSLAYYPSFVSGAEAAVKEITDRTNPEEIEFHLITLLFDRDALRQERIGNTIVYRVGFGGAYLSKILFIPLATLKARSLYKKEHIDALWALMTYMLLPVVLARFIGVTVPYVLTLQDGDSYEKVFERWFIKPLTPILDYGFRHAKIIQVISTYLGTWPKKRGYTGEVIQIYNGANPSAFETDFFSAAEAQNLKQELGKKEGDIFLVNTARLVHQKAFDITIRALTQLPGHIKFLIVGGGPDEVMLKELVNELDLNSRVIFIGPVDRTIVTQYRLVSDIFVMPSRTEGLGNAGLSAMASHLPFVGTTSGGLSEYVFDTEEESKYGKTGWVVDVDSPEQIAHSVENIIAHPEVADRVTKNARKMVEECFHWDSIASQMNQKIFSKLF